MKIEMHLHAKDLLEEYSPQEVIKAYKDRGYGGLIVTDIFKRKNFEKKGLTLQKFFTPYLALLQEGQEQGLIVMPGAELDHGGHFLIYGLLPDNFQELTTIGTFKKIREYVHYCNGLIIQAHPFREKDGYYYHQLNLNADGYEIINGSPQENNDELTQKWTDLIQKAKIVGSDTHDLVQGRYYIGMEMHLSDYGSLVQCIQSTANMSSKEVIDQLP